MKKHLILMLVSAALVLSAVDTSALTAEEVLRLKEKGVSDQTIQLMLQQETAKQEPDRTSPGVTETKTADRKSDIIYSTGEPSTTKIDTEEQEKIDNAWEMLKNMHLEFEN